MDPGISKTLAELKTWNIGLVNEIYQSYVYSNIVYNGNTFAIDSQSQAELTNLGALCSSLIANGQATQSFSRYNTSNTLVSLVATDMVIIAAQMRQYIMALQTTKQNHIVSINAVVDIPTLLAYDVTVNWPSNSTAPTITFPTTTLAPVTPPLPTSGISNGTPSILSGGAGGTTSGDGGNITVKGGSPVSGNGGTVYITGSDAGGAAFSGGNVFIQAGNSTGGTDGIIQFNTGGVANRFTIDGTGALLIAGSAGIAGQVFTSGGPGVAPSWTNGGGGGGSGTVTSVALVEGSTIDLYAITGSPVTTSGTLTFTLVNQTANKIFAGPTTGAAAQPTFRSLVAADIPTISLTTGVSGLLPVGNGGTGVGSSTGSGSVVLSTSPALVTPDIGAATGTSLALGGGTALTTTNRTGTGNLVLATSPTLVTPALGVATATSIAIGGGTALATSNQTGTGSLVLATSPTLTTPNIGAATGTSLTATGTIVSTGTAGVGYATGAGGTVTQSTSRTTGVTLNKICGTITTNTTSLATSGVATFTVTNSTVAIGDVIVLAKRSGATNVNTSVSVTAVAAGSFNITVFNQNTTTAETGAIVINFVVIKAVTA